MQAAAPSFEHTDWAGIVAMYDRLLAPRHVEAAVTAYDEALARCGNDVERRFLIRRRDRLTA